MNRLIALLSVCVAVPVGAAQLMFPAPASAIKPAHVVIAPGASEQDYFWLNESYPSMTAVEHYKKVFSSWRPCFGRDREWWSFADRASGRDSFVHELHRHWVNPKDDVAVTLVLKYTSPGASWRPLPDTDEQFVALVRIKQPNAEKLLGEMGVKCEKAS